MSKWGRNGEGYADSTAGIAIGRVSRDERKTVMAKKRSCGRTAHEHLIHEKAVKMRKMTDIQLVNYVEEKVGKARDEGFNQGKAQAQGCKTANIEKIINEIGDIRGIGEAKLEGIQAILEKHLGVWTNV